MTDLGGCVDELDLQLLGLPGLGGWEDGLSEDEWSLSGSSDSSLDHDEVLVDMTVVWESTEWGDRLGDGISGSGGVVLGTSSSDSVDLLVELGSAVVSHLTASGNCPLDSRWMPGSDTGDLTATSMGLALKSLNSESLHDTLSSLTSGDSDGINALVLLEDLRDLDLLLELGLGPLDLVSNGSSVDLDLHEVRLVLSESEFADLGGANDTDNRAVLDHAGDVLGNWLLGSLLISVGVLGEALLLGLRPVLVESSLDILVELLGPDGAESAESTWGWDVSDETNDLHWWALNDRDGVYPISVDQLLTFTTLLNLDDVSHTGLVSHEGSEVDLLGGVIPWVGSDATTVMSGTSLWKIGQRSESWMLEFSVGQIGRAHV